MTQNQIAYQNAQELKRHNIAAETETARHQQLMEQYEAWKNKLTEMSINETRRANLAAEANNARRNEIQEEQNIRQAEIQRQQNAINAASVAETLRHNQEAERLSALSTQSQSALNKALESQAAATSASSYASAAASYANAELSREKADTEITVRALNSANAGLGLTRQVTETYQQNLLTSQTGLNKQKIKESKANVGYTQVRATHEGVNTLWDSISGAAGLLTGLGGLRPLRAR